MLIGTCTSNFKSEVELENLQVLGQVRMHKVPKSWKVKLWEKLFHHGKMKWKVEVRWYNNGNGLWKLNSKEKLLKGW